MPKFPDDVFDEQRRAAEAAYLEARARHERLLKAFSNHLSANLPAGEADAVEQMAVAVGRLRAQLR